MMKPGNRQPAARECAYCKGVIYSQRDALFLEQDGVKKLYHKPCYHKWQKETVQRLRKEAQEQRRQQAAPITNGAEPERQRIATPCLTCEQRRTRVWTGTASQTHVRCCIKGHFQMVTAKGAVAISQYTAEVWKVNSKDWHGLGPDAMVRCCVCNVTFQRKEGPQHVVEKHATRTDYPVPKQKETPVAAPAVKENPQPQQKPNLGLDDLLLELATRISAEIASMREATQQSVAVAKDLKVLVEQLLRGGR